MEKSKCNTGKIVHLLFSISSCGFFLINRNLNIDAKSFLIQLWGFSIWIYLLVAFIQAMNVMATKQTRKQTILFAINLLSQIGILIAFSSVYVAAESRPSLKYESVGILCYFLVLIIVELITSLFYRGHCEKYVLTDGNLNSGIVQDYIYNKIIRSIKIPTSITIIKNIN